MALRVTRESNETLNSSLRPAIASRRRSPRLWRLTATVGVPGRRVSEFSGSGHAAL